jgi:peptidyl-prolyl cis-trans isomerase SurA
MKRVIITLAGVALAGAILVQRVQAAHVVERIVARVNSEIITQRQYDKEKASIREELQKDYSGPELDAKVADESKNLLRNLIDESLMVQKAKDEDINVETDLIKKLDQIRKQQNVPTIEDLQKAAEQEGVNWEDFKEKIRRQLLMNEVISRDVGSRIVITREEARKYYNAHKEDLKSPGMVRLSEILISNEKYKPEEAEKRAKDAEAELKGGARFTDVVKKYSDDTNTDQGGDIGYQKISTLPASLAATLDKLDPNEFTEPIQVRNGYMILKLTERYSPGIPTFEEVESRINEMLYSQQMEPKLRDYLTQLRQESYIFKAPGYEDTGDNPLGTALASEKNP